MKRLSLALMLIATIIGCRTSNPSSSASASLPAPQGTYHAVRAGETLWRIASAYGVSVSELVESNQIDDPQRLIIGQELFVPIPDESEQFFWPLRGNIKQSANPYGIEIDSSRGRYVRASRTGKVAVAANALRGWGRTVLLEHDEGYLSIYAGMGELLVNPGDVIKQGAPLGRVGGQGLYFEIRQFAISQEPLALLPDVGA